MLLALTTSQHVQTLHALTISNMTLHLMSVFLSLTVFLRLQNLASI